MSAPLQLRGRRAEALLTFAGDVARCRDIAGLRAQIAMLPALIGADSVAVTTCRDWASDFVIEHGDQSVYRPELASIVVREWRDHPVMRDDLARPGHGVHRISDFVQLRQWQRTELFNGFYRPLGMTRELAVQVSWGPAGSSCCLVAHRAGRDFSERDLAVLAMAAPHLQAARARLRAQALVAERLALVEQALEGAGRGVVVVDAQARVIAMGDAAQALLERWFGAVAPVLPAQLATWSAAACGRPATSAVPDLELERDGRRLRARLVRARDESVIVLTERDETVMASAARLARLLPITQREADVLARLAAGHTNDGIAHDLRISRHTVIRHVESVYAKLDVHTRAAATRAAMEALRDDA
jgi:DNA-binding CsgD family transcriptional regulator